MDIRKVTAVYFSPTRGSRGYAVRIAEAVSGRLGVPMEELDLTRPGARAQEYWFHAQELVVFAAPVYAGRLPQIEGGLFDRVHGNGTPAVYTVSYGNREYEDALLEEADVCDKNGFHGIAAGAWVAPHTFSNVIAAGRPDESDLHCLAEFAERVAELLQRDETQERKLSVPGGRPYRTPKTMPFHPKGNKNCTGCGVCRMVCPTGAIGPDTLCETDQNRCINCFACVKQCPAGARNVRKAAFKALTLMLETKLCRERKEPAVFYAIDSAPDE